MKSRLARLMKKYGVRPKKYLSQNFLISPSVIDYMCSFAQGRVIEIGAGFGFITERLALSAERVYAYEKDATLSEILAREYDFQNVEIIGADFLTSKLPPFDTVVANIPYRYSSDITFKLLGHPFLHAVLSYQKEYAERLCERSGSRLAVMAESLSERTYLRTIPSRCYYPRPETDSALVKIVPHQKFAIDRFFEDVVRALFSHRNQTVRNALTKSRDLFAKGKEEMRTAAALSYLAERKVSSLDVFEVRQIADELKAIIADQGS